MLEIKTWIRDHDYSVAPNTAGAFIPPCMYVRM